MTSYINSPIRQFSLAVCALPTPLANARQDDHPIVSNDDISQYLQEHEPQWQTQIPERGTRLFYTEAQWPDVIAALNDDTGLRPEFRNVLFKIANRLSQSEPQVYSTPEQISASSGKDLFDSEQELWQRGVGDDIFLLSLTAKLSDNPYDTKQLHDTVLTSCRYPQWGRREVNQDLACGHMARAVALAWDWHRDLFNEGEQVLIRETMQARCNDLFDALRGGNFWSSSYTENHNHVNASALGFAGLAFYGDIPEAKEWLAGACLNFKRVAQYSAKDGSSAEGVPYWTYSMSFILQFIEATKQFTRADRFYEMPFIQNAAAYRIGSSTPGFEGTLPWGDAPLRDYYGAHHILARLAAEYNDSEAQYVMKNLPYDPQGGNDVNALLLMWYKPCVNSTAPKDLDYHAANCDVVSTRSGWGHGDYMLSIKSGFTNRNHSHLDAGSFAFTFGKTWMLLAPGYGKGSGQADFWKSAGPRWDFFSNSTESHCTLLINGKKQLFDSNARATMDCYVSTPTAQWTSIDLSRAYHGDMEVRRNVLHMRNDYILTLDHVAAQTPVDVEWLAQIPASANVDKSSIQIPALAGDLEINILQPNGGSLYPREATSPQFDKPNPEQASYAVASSGERVEFAVLMQPHFRDALVNDLKAEAATSPDGVWHASVASTNWHDQMIVNPAIAEVNWATDFPELQPPKLTAKVGLIRIEDNLITRVFAVQAIEFMGQPMQATSDHSVSFSLEKKGRAWVLNLNKPISGHIQPGEGLKLFDATLSPITTGEATQLASGTYLLAPDMNSAEATLIQTKSTGTTRELPPKIQPT
jgi:hypothetical protein